jgi:hypothetical protein
VARWSQTKIWKTLSARRRVEDAALTASLRVAMPELERTACAEQDPEDALTWYDPLHAERVAALMCDVVSPQRLERLSGYELALLLLASYAHDIGMSPRVSRAAALCRHLLTANGTDLSEADERELQDWLDVEERGLEPPLQDAGDEGERDRRARLLTARYVRDRHVEWGENWVRDHLSAKLPGDEYPELGDDLALICRVHRGSLAALSDPDLDPRFLRRGAVVVHRRYIACVLRTADALDLDPERVPDVMISGREASLAAALRWRGAPELTFSIEEDGRVLAEARPSSARRHRAVDDTITQVENELRMARDIDAAAPFGRAPRRTRPLPHAWRLEPIVYRDVRPRDDRYVYVNGSFRPNTQKLLELLAGRDLYGEPMVALRELVQNAFDAVRERLARQRLQEGEPLDPDTVARLRGQHRVALELLRRDDGRWWLACRDSGGGMSREIITDYLLVSGSSRPADVYSLERRARAAGFVLERSGRFGIGVLSYFMLADRVELRTRRCLEAPSGEYDAWRFATDGVGSFGELRRDPDWTEGTEVALRLREDADLEKFAAALRQFVRRTPCPMTFVRAGETELTFAAGWVTTSDELTDEFVESVAANRDDDTPEHLRGPRHRERQRTRATLERQAEAIRTRIRWSSFTGSTDDGAASYRLLVPYFELEGGRSLAYMDIRSVNGVRVVGPLGQGELLSPRFAGGTSHDGLALEVKDVKSRRAWRETHFPERPYHLEIDWHSGVVAPETVRRTAVAANDAVTGARSEIMRRAAEAVAAVVREDPDSPYARLSRKMRAFPPKSLALEPLPGENAWTIVSDAEDRAGLEWAPLEGLAVDGNSERPLRLRGERVARLYPASHRAAGLVAPHDWWRSEEYPAELCAGALGRRFVQVFDVPNQTLTAEDELGTARFPAAAASLLMVRHKRGPIFNRDHPLVLGHEASVRKAWSDRIEARVPLDEQLAILASDPAQLASWFCAIVQSKPGLTSFERRLPEPGPYWDAVVERSEEVPRRLFDLVASASGAPRVIWSLDQSRHWEPSTLARFDEQGHQDRAIEGVIAVDGAWQLDAGDQLEPG